MLIAQYLILSDAGYDLYDEFFSNDIAKITNDLDLEYTNTAPLITRLQNPILSKAHVNHLNDSLIEILDESEFVLVEREDVLDQVLSQALATAADRWNNKHTESIEAFNYPRYILSRDMFEHHLKCRELYTETKDTFKNVLGTVHYEDIGKVSCVDILKNLGFNNEDVLSKIDESKLFKKLISREDKLSLLENYYEVKIWCDDCGIKFL